MIDFLIISTRPSKRGVIEIYPKFRLYPQSKDLMIRGGDFYAIWDEDRMKWSTSESDALRLIDNALDIFAEENKDKFDASIKILHMWDSESGMIDAWHKYCQKQMRDSFTMLDEKLIFSNSKPSKADYSSKSLSYPLEKTDISGYEKLISTLYLPEERHKIEWAIGSIITGDSKDIQKFMVLYGSAGTGKSTILNIIEQLFDGYFSVFDAKALGSSSNAFALEAFKSNPLVAIQHDGDLSRIEDNTRLNSLVSHELMTVNEKFKSTYTNRFKAFLFMGTNKPVKITDAKSGLLRRLIDVTPSGNLLSHTEYDRIKAKIPFELGGIACHCRDVYLENPNYYDGYVPVSMLGASNDFYNFVMDNFILYEKNDSTTLKASWEMYEKYAEDTKMLYPMPQRIFKEELKNYFLEYKERTTLEDGTRVRNYYSGFITDKFTGKIGSSKYSDGVADSWLNFKEQHSILDDFCQNSKAQYANDFDTPYVGWDKVVTKLKDLDTHKLHYLKPDDISLIVIDFDIKDETGNKSLDKNIEAASKWPSTYAELSKSGGGIHLHYIYEGDVSKLANIFSENIEIKVFNGGSSLRRMLTKCNDIPIATISSGLPLKEEKDTKMLSDNVIFNEKAIRTIIKKNLNKEYHGYTKPSIDYIYDTLEKAYKSGIPYDVSDMENAIYAFAAQSSNQAKKCMKIVDNMHFKSESNDILLQKDTDDDSDIVFFDVEVFPNLFLINWKVRGEGKPIVRMINPKPQDIEPLLKLKLVGFNNRRYDNHMLYACLLGYTNEQIYDLSQRIISGEKNAMFGKAYNISYTDIYDFSSKKQSLKKFEIELGIHHQELGLPWDQPVPESKWITVAEYCDNDVIATEKVFEKRYSDFVARKILAKMAGMTVNDTTNSLSTTFIFEGKLNPQNEFNYRDMGDESQIAGKFTITQNLVLYSELGDEYSVFDTNGRPIFPGYEYKNGVSTYRGEEVGEGGYVYAEPGMYGSVALLDIASMHPSSIIAENLFGDRYTKRFKEIVDARLCIKHKDFDKAKTLLNGALAEFLNDEEATKNLAQALKIVINSVYGLTMAKFNNPFKDIRNIDNIVAKRGALFMINLKHEVQKRGYTVAHIKTDSIKIPDADQAIIDFVMEYGHMYGYNFEHEATYDKMCLVNNAVYIAKYDNGEWTATGKQFAVPYVYKTLFTKEQILFEDMCETFSVSKGDLYLDYNEKLPDVSEYEELKSVRLKYPDWTTLGLESCRKADKLLNKFKDITDEELDAIINKGHALSFVGRVGQFTPVLPGNGGGELYRVYNGKLYAASGSTGYRWFESEKIKGLDLPSIIDRSFYDKLVEDAKAEISKYGDFEWFVSDDKYVSKSKEDDVAPWDDAIPFALR